MTRDSEAYQFLSRLASRMQEVGVTLPHSSGDGRVDSQANENLVIDAAEVASKALSRELGVRTEFLRGKERHWYDLALVIHVNGERYLAPVNVKISSFKQADNVSSKLGLFYALTGHEPLSENPSWNDYHMQLSDFLGHQKDADYYFLVVEKDGVVSGRIFAQSMKRLQKVVPNGSNPPFQCKWGDNTIPKQRSYDEAVQFLLSGLFASHRKKAATLISFEEALGSRVARHD